MIKAGIIGAGTIAEVMADTLRRMGTVERYGIAAREYVRAEAFARRWGFRKAYGSYEEMVRDPEVELIYIATPHSHHAAHIRLCLENGKHVLCEKAFTVNAAQAREVLALAEAKGLLLTEAVWTRYMPMRRTLEAIIAGGKIGVPHMLTANLCYLLGDRERYVRPELAGGALLDLGIYPLNFAAMVFGGQIESICGQAVMTETGVDAQNSITLRYRDGKMALLNSSFRFSSDRRGLVYGDQGYVEVANISNFERLDVYGRNRELLETYAAPKQITGYEYEVEACVRAIENGELECAQLPHAETIRMMEWMDELRGQWGMRYPMEAQT